MSGISVMLGLAAAALSSACCTAQPVASATWTMRRWLCPPSRVRCSRRRRRSANGTPSSISRAIAARRRADDMLDHRAVVEARAGDHRVVDMGVEAVAFLEHRGDPALRPVGRALAERALGDHRDLARLGEVERRGQPGRARADDQDVELAAHAAASARGQAQEHVLQVGVAGRHVDDPEPVCCKASSTWPALTWSLR